MSWFPLMETAMTRNEQFANVQIAIVLTTAKAFFGFVTALFVSLLEPDMFRMAPTHKI
jgi:hypothetical protein